MTTHQAGPGRGALQALEALERHPGWGLRIQDERPMRDGLEWQLSQHVWLTQGARPFVQGDVPYVVNNSGTLSAQVAALLLAALDEHPVPAGPLRVLELGAGVGLFARLLLDALQGLCAERGSDAYDRLEYWVTDASPTSVAHWAACDLFGPHAGRVVTRACTADQAHALQPGPWLAVLANYVLDVLPARVVRYTASGWEQLHASCWIRADEATLGRYTTLTPQELRDLAGRADAPSLDALVPLLPLLESEAVFRPMDADRRPSWPADPAPDQSFTVNDGALACLDGLLPRLAPGGLCLVTDYSAEPGVDAQQQMSQRFGAVSSIGLNLPALDRHVAGAGFHIAAPTGDGQTPLRHRLITPVAAPRTVAAFDALLSTQAQHWRDEPLGQARQCAADGRWARALPLYREAIRRAPHDWAVQSEAAAFAGTELADPALAAALARAALASNPWTNANAWCVLGEALLAQGQHQAALDALEQARRIHPGSARAHLLLARGQRAVGQLQPALASVAAGLGSDRDAMTRHLLLAEQGHILDALALVWMAERAAAARRNC